MTKIIQTKGAKGFEYSDAPQKSPEWLAIRAPRVGASELSAWLAVDKRNGKPLKARTDLEREKAFAKAFNTPFSRFTTDAMQAGIDNESFVRDQYSSAMGVAVEKAGCFYNDHFVASPDGLVGKDGLVEIKWLWDNKFTEVLTSQQPLPEHYLQIQGQLWASGREWCDYIVANGNTGRFTVIRVTPDEETIKRIADSVPAVADIKPLTTDGVFEFTSGAPVAQIGGENPWS